MNYNHLLVLSIIRLLISIFLGVFLKKKYGINFWSTFVLSFTLTPLVIVLFVYIKMNIHKLHHLWYPLLTMATLITGVVGVLVFLNGFKDYNWFLYGIGMCFSSYKGYFVLKANTETSNDHTAEEVAQIKDDVTRDIR